jgi:hypothetical protein
MTPTPNQPANTISEKRELVAEQLDRVLGFFSRAESKMSFLFALNSALLVIIALNLEAADFYVWYLALCAISSVSFLTLSLHQLYLSWSPSLSGGEDSLIYFRAIAGRKEAEYIAKFTSQSEDDYIKDALSQVWRNSTILAEKFSRVDLAFRLTATGFVPWFIFLVGSSFIHGRLPIIS